MTWELRSESDPAPSAGEEPLVSLFREVSGDERERTNRAYGLVRQYGGVFRPGRHPELRLGLSRGRRAGT
jgi:hypothetical protein